MIAPANPVAPAIVDKPMIKNFRAARNFSLNPIILVKKKNCFFVIIIIDVLVRLRNQN